MGEQLSRYLRKCVTTFTLAQPQEPDDLVHAMEAVRRVEIIVSAMPTGAAATGR